MNRSKRIYTLDEIRAIAAPLAREYGVGALYLFCLLYTSDAADEL